MVQSKAIVRHVLCYCLGKGKSILGVCCFMTVSLLYIYSLQLYPSFSYESSLRNFSTSTPLPPVARSSTQPKVLGTIAPVPPLHEDELKISPKESWFRERVINMTLVDRIVLAELGMTLPRTGGVAKRIMIVSTFRSGSTFVGQILSAVPGVLYHFEPLTYLGPEVVPVGDEMFAQTQVDEITRVLNCDYVSFQEQLRVHKIPPQSMMVFNDDLHNTCLRIDNDPCRHEERLAFACPHFPVQVTKLVRMPLRYVLPLLRRPELKLHVVLLVRDPRATMASRHLMKYCKGACAEQEGLCEFLRDNYRIALEASKEFPDSFTLVRYEDLAVDPGHVSAWLLQRVGLPLTPSVKEYIQTHTTTDGGQHQFTKRKLGSRVSLWKSTLPWEEIESIQNSCGDVLPNYGYIPVRNPASLEVSDTVKPFWALP